MGGFWILQGWEGGFGAPHLPPNLNPKFQGRIQAGGSHTDTDGGGWDAGAGGSWVFLRPNNEKRRIPPQLGEQQQWGGGGGGGRAKQKQQPWGRGDAQGGHSHGAGMKLWGRGMKPWGKRLPGKREKKFC